MKTGKCSFRISIQIKPRMTKAVLSPVDELPWHVEKEKKRLAENGVAINISRHKVMHCHSSAKSS